MQVITLNSIKAHRKQTNCYCNVYHFPHRAGSCNGKTKPVERNCFECRHGVMVTDYNGTGDRWNVQFDCGAKGIRPCED